MGTQKSNVVKAIDGTYDKLKSAKESALSLIADDKLDVNNLINSEKLQDVENGIKELNDYSSKCWLLSAVLLYALVYDGSMYQQSGLTWYEYCAESKKRLNMDKHDISQALCSADFFIKHHKDLIKAGFKPTGMARKLSRANLALELSGDLKATISHLVNDTWVDFQDWFHSFQELPQAVEIKRPDIVIEKNKVKIGGVEAVSVSDKLDKDMQLQINNYLLQIFRTLQEGNVPAIVSVYDEKEASTLVRLRDKNRQSK